eukprot:759379-Hanusia_phi.AAC.1
MEPGAKGIAEDDLVEDPPFAPIAQKPAEICGEEHDRREGGLMLTLNAPAPAMIAPKIAVRSAAMALLLLKTLNFNPGPPGGACSDRIGSPPGPPGTVGVRVTI